MINKTVSNTAIRHAAAVESAAPLWIDLVHHVPGRLRLKAAALKGDMRACVKARCRLGSIDGVTAVTVHPQTGGVIVEYDAKRVSPDSIISMLAQHGYAVSPSYSTSQVAGGRLDKLADWLARSFAEALVERAAMAIMQGLVLA